MVADGDRDVAFFGSSFFDVFFGFWLQQQMSISAVNSFTALRKREHCGLWVGLIWGCLQASCSLAPCWGESPPCGNLLPLTDSHLWVCCSVQVSASCQVLWLPATVFVAVCRSWAGRSLLVSSRSVDPTGMCARKIILALELAVRQPGSCGWWVSLARSLSRGSPAALVEWEREAGVPAGSLGTGADALAHLAVWQHRTKDVQKLWWREETLVWRVSSEKSLNWKVALIHAFSPDSRAQRAINADYWSFVLCRDSPPTRCVRSEFRCFSKLFPF